jgi:mannose-6-phosphate isomerase-like protein (cupin superfamily)
VTPKSAQNSVLHKPLRAVSVGSSLFARRLGQFIKGAMLRGVALLSCLLLGACGHGPAPNSVQAKRPNIFGVSGPVTQSWSAAELEQDVAVQTLRVLPEASYHLVRLKGSEKPHYHDRSDLLSFVLEGHVAAHVGTDVFEAYAGDVIEIPRGTLHWIENRAAVPSIAYVVFSPAFDGKDRRFASANTPSTASANAPPAGAEPAAQ